VNQDDILYACRIFGANAGAVTIATNKVAKSASDAQDRDNIFILFVPFSMPRNPKKVILSDQCSPICDENLPED
jgi:hypothetical protein